MRKGGQTTIGTLSCRLGKQCPLKVGSSLPSVYAGSRLPGGVSKNKKKIILFTVVDQLRITNYSALKIASAINTGLGTDKCPRLEISRPQPADHIINRRSYSDGAIFQSDDLTDSN